MLGKHALLVAVIIPRLLHNSLPLLISRQPVEKCVAEVTLHWLWLVMMDRRRLCQPSRAAQPGLSEKKAAKYLHIIHRFHLIMRHGISCTFKTEFQTNLQTKNTDLSQYDKLHDKELLVFESKYFQLHYSTCCHVRNCSAA